VTREGRTRAARNMDDPTGVEIFARIVAPCRWEQVTIQMLAVRFDDSYLHDKYERATVAGFASSAQMWSEFDRQWQRRLDEDNLACFPVAEFARSTGVFSDWRNASAGRKALVADLFGIIKKCGLRKYGPIVRSGPAPMLALPAAALKAASQFYDYCCSEGIFSNVYCAFERGEHEELLRAAFCYCGYEEPHFTWGSDQPERKGKRFAFRTDPFRGLQAADLLITAATRPEMWDEMQKTMGWK
jgi:hypothetical protein